MALNPFQEGQNFEINRVAKTLENERSQKRNEGINALAEEFGPGANAPTEFATVTGADRAERQLNSNLEQRDITNERNAKLDANAEEDRERNILRQNLGNFVGGMIEAQKRGATPEQIRDFYGPALRNGFRMTEEELEALPAQMAEDPNFLPTFQAALKTSSDRKVYGAPREITFPDGRTVIRQQYTDGSHEDIDGRLTDSQQKEARLDQADQRLQLTADKQDPVKSGLLSSSKKAGEKLAEAVTEGLPQAEQLVNTVMNGQRALELIDEGIRTGSFANTRQGASRFFADIIGIEQDAIAETDEFRGIAGAFVAEQIKAFGAGTGLSDADREFAKGIVGGDIEMDVEAIKRLVTIQNKINKGKINNYNRLRDAFIERNPDFGKAYPRVTIPGDQKVLTFNPETGRLE